MSTYDEEYGAELAIRYIRSEVFNTLTGYQPNDAYIKALNYAIQAIEKKYNLEDEWQEE